MIKTFDVNNSPDCEILDSLKNKKSNSKQIWPIFNVASLYIYFGN